MNLMQLIEWSGLSPQQLGAALTIGLFALFMLYYLAVEWLAQRITRRDLW